LPNQQIIRSWKVDLNRRINGDVRSGQELAVLMGIAVDGIVDEVGANGAIVQQGVALARRTISGNFLSTALGLEKEFEQFALGFLYLTGKARVRLYLRVPQFFLSFAKISDSRGYAVRGVLGLPGKNAQRDTGAGQSHDLQERQAR